MRCNISIVFDSNNSLAHPRRILSTYKTVLSYTENQQYNRENNLIDFFC